MRVHVKTFEEERVIREGVAEVRGPSTTAEIEAWRIRCEKEGHPARVVGAVEQTIPDGDLVKQVTTVQYVSELDLRDRGVSNRANPVEYAAYIDVYNAVESENVTGRVLMLGEPTIIYAFQKEAVEYYPPQEFKGGLPDKMRFSAVVLDQALSRVEEPWKLIQHARRLVNTGGLFVVFDRAVNSPGRKWSLSKPIADAAVEGMRAVARGGYGGQRAFEHIQSSAWGWAPAPRGWQSWLERGEGLCPMYRWVVARKSTS